MNESESRLISLIQNSTDPAAALDVALKLVQEFLSLPQASRCTSSEPLAEVS
jgi:hypothetical protein